MIKCARMEYWARKDFLNLIGSQGQFTADFNRVADLVTPIDRTVIFEISD